MADKEIFNQTLKSSYGSTDRIAVGTPGQDGCDNITMENFASAIQKANVETGAIGNGDLVANVWSYNHAKNTVYIDFILFDENGLKKSVDDMLTVTDANNIEIDFGGSISGSWKYIFLYWNI